MSLNWILLGLVGICSRLLRARVPQFQVPFVRESLSATFVYPDVAGFPCFLTFPSDCVRFC